MQRRELFGTGDYRHSSSQHRKLFFFFLPLLCPPPPLTLSLSKRDVVLFSLGERASRCVPPHWKRLTLFCPLSLICVLHAGQSCTLRHRVMAVESKGCLLAYAKLQLTQSTELYSSAFNATWNHLVKRIMHVIV